MDGACAAHKTHLREVNVAARAFLQNASESNEYASIADANALFVLAGDPAAEDEPVRKGTAFQVRACMIFHVGGQACADAARRAAMAAWIRVPHDISSL
jgi:hypothetical protein